MSDAGTALEHVTPGKGFIDFDQAVRYATVVAKSGLVPATLKDNPNGVMVVGLYGQELGVPFIAALSEVHVIEGRPSPSSQLRLALIRRAGHEARFVESTNERAVIVGRRRENRRDPEAWARVEWTLEDAARAHLTDRWVERWISKEGTDGKRRNVLEKEIVGNHVGIFTAEDRARLGLKKQLPEWAVKALDAGEIKWKDNWEKYPQAMLSHRAASALCRLEFSDVLLGMDANMEEFTAEERGVDVEVEPESTAPAPGAEPDDDDPDIFDADVVGEERLVDEAWVKGYSTTFEDLGLDEDQAEAIVHMATSGRARRLSDLRIAEVPELRRWVRSVNSGEHVFIDMDGAVVVAPRSPEGGPDAGQLPLDDETAA